METTHTTVVTERTVLSERMVRIGLRHSGWETTGVGDEFIHVEVGAETPDGNDGHTSRHYTVSSVGDGTLEIEVFLHGDGPGAMWARAVQPGDAVKISDPKAYYAVPQDSGPRVLVGDLTALPAIARILAQAAADEEFVVVCEVPTAAEQRELPSAATVDVEWRVGGNGAGRSTMADAVRDIARVRPALMDRHPYIWVGCESKESRRARQVLRTELGLAPSTYRVVGYWHLDLQRALAAWENATDEQRLQYASIWREDRTDEENWIELEPFLQRMGV